MSNSQDAKLAVFWWKKTLEMDGKHFQWPIITDKIRNIVLEQLDKTLSIYDRSGIIKEFEENFARYHWVRYWITFNSGTSALLAMYEGINLMPWDEILAPNYTFFATNTPLVYMGYKPKLIDCNSDGNIDPKEIEKNITKNTKAVVVTHMWGIPCDMDEIVKICKERKILLLEDCSHAHGAQYKWKKVGTFWDAAIWSLQWQKIITGGEWWILLTNDKEIHDRALLLGHYNKRSLQQIEPENQYHQYATTWFWLKLRAHPVAITIANEQFSHLDNWIHQKNKFASKIIDELKDIPFLTMPRFEDKVPSWYAFVMQYDKSKAKNLSIEVFIKLLHKEWLMEIDRPLSTMPNNNLPLFVNPEWALNKDFYGNENNDNVYSNSEKFYQNAIKIPIWVNKTDLKIVEKYILWIKKIARFIDESIDLSNFTLNF